MKIIAIKDCSTGNDTVGAMWKETKVFDHTDMIVEVMEWVGSQKCTVVLTIPDNYEQDEIQDAFSHGRRRRTGMI